MDKKRTYKRTVQEHEIQRYRADSSEHSRKHFSYELENQIASAIEHGDREAVYLANAKLLGADSADPAGAFDIDSLMKDMRSHAGVMSTSDKKQVEYAVVASITIMTRAAIRGGLDPYRAYDISDLFLQRLSETSDIIEYWSILFGAVDSFTGEVRKVRTQETRSIHTLHARQYIGQNLNKPLTLDEIAGAVGLSPTYLSAVFKETEGIGLKQYIIRQRMEAAQNLLLYSDADIGTIATYVGFCDQSHFGKMFKQQTGMTPLTYRKTMQK